MTFDRFYSIIRPHKAASFNTTKRARITITCVILECIFFNIPHWFVTGHDGWLCLPFGNKLAMKMWYSQFYYWLSFSIQYAIPLIFLLSMNGVIIHTLHTRMGSAKDEKSLGEEQSQGQGQNS